MAKILLTSFALALILDHTNALLHCDVDVIPNLIPCTRFMVGQDANPPNACCIGLQNLAKMAAASELDRKVICRCFKAALGTIPVDYSKAKLLPGICGFNSFVPIDPNLDCTKVI